jgi:hypothetical protein
MKKVKTIFGSVLFPLELKLAPNNLMVNNKIIIKEENFILQFFINLDIFSIFHNSLIEYPIIYLK